MLNLQDKLNPEFLFSETPNDLLIKGIKGEIDFMKLAKKEMANRGYDLNNLWIGFEKAKELYEVLTDCPSLINLK